MTNEELKAEAQRALKQYHMQVNHSIPYIVVDTIEEPAKQWYFQGDEAANILDECPDYLNEKEYIAYLAVGW